VNGLSCNIVDGFPICPWKLIYYRYKRIMFFIFYWMVSVLIVYVD